MQRFALLIASFLGSVAAVSVERGLYFFTENQFHYGRVANLWLGLLLGLSCMSGALLSHGMAKRWGERRVMLSTLMGQVIVLSVLAAWPRPATIWLTVVPFGLLTGAMWPIFESYLTAGLDSRQMLQEVGRFCVAWSLAVPIALAVSGPLIESAHPALLFVMAAACHSLAGVMLLRLPARPAHLAHDDPQRPDQHRLRRYRQLMISSRWLMLGAYALLFLLAPLMPHILVTKLGQSTPAATSIAALVDWARLIGFVALGLMTAWYGRTGPLLAVIVLMPAGFFAVLFGPSVAWVIAGECVFGLVSGLVYYAALFYALAARNAAIEAAGAHEALVGLGLVLGPVVGLIGLGLADVLGDDMWGMLAIVVPMILLCAIAGLRPLLQLRLPQMQRGELTK